MDCSSTWCFGDDLSYVLTEPVELMFEVAPAASKSELRYEYARFSRQNELIATWGAISNPEAEPLIWFVYWMV